MGFLNLFVKAKGTHLVHLPSGSFTLDRDGRVLTSTLPSFFPQSHLREIGQRVLAVLEAARQAQMPLSEVLVAYAALKILVRELRGGAIVFLMPQALNQPVKSASH